MSALSTEARGVGVAYSALSRMYRTASSFLAWPLYHGSFTFDGREYPYVIRQYNPTWRNERIVEIALGQDALARHRGRRILEVGNVMAHYGHVGHDVVDLFEKAPGVTNVDVVDFRADAGYDLILAISTLEHVGFDEEIEEPDKPVRAVAHLKSLLAPGGELFVTAPLGWNRDLDLAMRADAFGFDSTRYLMRVSRRNRWCQVGPADVRRARYGAPYPAANALAVGSFRAH